MNMNFRFDIPTKLLFGCGELNRLGELPLPGKKALIVIKSGKSSLKLGKPADSNRVLRDRVVQRECGGTAVSIGRKAKYILQ